MVTTPNYDLDIDTTLGGNNASDYIVPSQKAIKAYVDNSTGGNVMWGNIVGNLSNQTDLQDALNDKQDELVSGTNIKTINNISILGSGNIEIQTTVDDELSTTSENPVQNKVITGALDDKQDSFNPLIPITLEEVISGGPHNVTVNGDTTSFAYNTIQASNSSGLVLTNSTVASPTNLSDLFSGNCSYIDIPVTLGEDVESYVSGQSSYAGVNIYLGCSSVNASNRFGFLFCNKTSNNIEPLAFSYVCPNSNSFLMLQTGTITQSSGGITCPSLYAVSSGTQGTTDYNVYNYQTVFNISQDTGGFRWNLYGYGYNNRGYTRYLSYADTNATFTDRMKGCNLVRVFGDLRGSTSTTYMPKPSLSYAQRVANTGAWENLDWSLSDGVIKDTVLSLNYDTTTLGLNSNNELTVIGKQDTLVSGTNIKTINNISILGSGNLTLDGLPSQTGQSGKFLTTDGTDASWGSATLVTFRDWSVA